MKRLILLLLGVFLLIASQACAHGPGVISIIPGRDCAWTPCQIGLWPFFLFDRNAAVYGLNLNLLAAYQSGEVSGLSAAPFNLQEADSAGISCGLITVVDRRHTGMVISLFSHINENRGVQIGLFNSAMTQWNNRSGGGMQLGLFNQSGYGFQIGLLNYNRAAWFPWLPLFNFSWKSAR